VDRWGREIKKRKKKKLLFSFFPNCWYNALEEIELPNFPFPSSTSLLESDVDLCLKINRIRRREILEISPVHVR